MAVRMYPIALSVATAALCLPLGIVSDSQVLAVVMIVPRLSGSLGFSTTVVVLLCIVVTCVRVDHKCNR
eukprot:4828645-Amphidinium_carterae.2